MSLRKNIGANYLSQAYVALVGIVVIPLYLRYMGAEAYGLVGFFAMLQSWFSLLDMGLTPTMSRETARLRGGATSPARYRALLRRLRTLFVAIAVLGGATLAACAQLIASKWLKVEHLSISDVAFAIRMMALIIALRWMAGLYRGILTGSEQLVWLGAYNVAAATAKALGVVPVLMFVGASPITFFGFQAIVAVFEFTVLLVKANSLIPQAPARARDVAGEGDSLATILRFSVAIAATSSIWTVATQVDKFILSKILPLADYGYFSLAAIVASGITIISAPVGSAIMPRMTRLEAQGNGTALLRVYKQTTQLVMITAVGSALTVAIYAEPLLRIWTGHSDVAARVAPILIPYALGNAVLAASSFPYYLQYSKGNVRLHVVGSLLFLTLLVPAVAWAAPTYGAVGAGYAWLIVNLAYFLAWVPFVHSKIEPGIHTRWILADILPVIAACLVVTGLVVTTVPHATSTPVVVFEIAATAIAMVALGAMAAPAVRSQIFARKVGSNVHSAESK